MLAEQLGGGFAKLGHIGAGGVERGQQGECVCAHRGLHQTWLAQLGFAQLGLDLGDVAATAGTAQRGGDPGH